MTDVADKLIRAAKDLRDTVDALAFSEPVTHVYNPLDYGWAPHEQYLKRFARPTCEVVFVGMNPGPWGMAQTGVPFGEIDAVRDWLGIDGPVGKPADEHPKRPVEGFACERSEVSGRRLWGLFAERFGEPDAFFEHHFIANYCPLVFMESSGRNRTPDKLPAAERDPLEAACDAHLRILIDALQPAWAIGVGAFAKNRLTRVLDGAGPTVGQILHPSPASPAANRGWAEQATRQLIELSVWA